MDTLQFIIDKFHIDLSQKSPFTINLERNTGIPSLFKELGFKAGAEIGVLEGVFSECLCQGMPDATIYSIDAWEYYPVANDFRRAKHYPGIFERAKARLAQYPNDKLIKKWSMDAVKDFADGSLDFVYIDSDHRFEYITNDIAEWGKKVRIGGIIAGHDFGEGASSKKYCHVSDVVPAWAKAHYIHPWFLTDDQVNGVSWFWVKGSEFYGVK
jgi:predicted O-methyltransferase YrrM